MEVDWETPDDSVTLNSTLAETMLALTSTLALYVAEIPLLIVRLRVAGPGVDV